MTAVEPLGGMVAVGAIVQNGLAAERRNKGQAVAVSQVLRQSSYLVTRLAPLAALAGSRRGGSELARFRGGSGTAKSRLFSPHLPSPHW